MTRDEVHRAFTPPDAPWSRWVKPVLFAALELHSARPAKHAPSWIETAVLAPLEPSRSYRIGQAFRDTALVIDLPGDASVWAGLAFAEHGFRPIPLFNAVPDSLDVRGRDSILIDMQPIMRALVDVAPHLEKIPPGAPPAFLLHADRHGDSQAVAAMRARKYVFDNRSVCRASDFPSAATLLSAGIARAVLIGELQPDLEPVLFDWQTSGITLWRRSADEVASPFVLARRFVLLRAWHAARAAFLPRRNDGSFGALVGAQSG